MKGDEPAGTGSRNKHSMARMIWLVQDAAARVIFIEEAPEDGDTRTAFVVARDLELDLRSLISEYEVAA
jgi:hypothetical protein